MQLPEAGFFHAVRRALGLETQTISRQENLTLTVVHRLESWLQYNRNILLLIIATISIHLPFALSSSFFSDESTYTYAAYTIGKGIVPYREVVLFHPPIGYLLLNLEVSLSGLNLFILRLLNILVFCLDLYVVFKLFKKIEVISGTALIAAGIYGLLPTVISYRLGSPIEFLPFSLFIYTGLYFFIGHVTDQTKLSRHLLVGLLLGLASMTWLVGIFVLVTVLLADLVGSRVARRSVKDVMLRLSIISAGAVTIGLAVLLVAAFVWKSLPQLLAQTVFYQSTVRTGLTLSQKLDLMNQNLPPLYLPLGLGVCGMVILILRRKAVGFEKSIVPVLLLAILLVLVTVVPKNPFGQFVMFLLPLMAFFSATALTHLDFQHARRVSLRLLVLYLVIIAAAVPSIVNLWKGQGYSVGSYDSYNLAEQYVGSYLKNNTSSSDLIWTSEGAIGLFSDRLIVPNNSTLWPYRAMYDDMFPCTWTGVLGITNQGLGLDNSREFIQGWNSTRVRVLVFIMGSGPIPYPDEILWNGCSQMTGVSGWVQAHFHQTENFVFTNVPYDYSIWMRN